MWDYIMYVSQYQNSHSGPGPYLWVYYWDGDPVSNVSDLYSDEFSLNTLQLFKVV